MRKSVAERNLEVRRARLQLEMLVANRCRAPVLGDGFYDEGQIEDSSNSGAETSARNGLLRV